MGVLERSDHALFPGDGSEIHEGTRHGGDGQAVDDGDVGGPQVPGPVYTPQPALALVIAVNDGEHDGPGREQDQAVESGRRLVGDHGRRPDGEWPSPKDRRHVAGKPGRL